MSIQSQFSKLSKRQLIFICEKLIDENFPIGNPYNYDFEEAYNVLNTVSQYFSIQSTHEDVEFFCKLLEVNDELIAEVFANNREQMKNKGLIEKLVIPVSKTYVLNYQIDGSCSYEEFLSQEFDSYDKEWVRDSAEVQRNDGNWDYYDGKFRADTKYDNFEMNDVTYNHVYEVNSNENSETKESILDRLVIENTEDVVSSLDRDTLLKLKSIIESRLRLF